MSEFSDKGVQGYIRPFPLVPLTVMKIQRVKPELLDMVWVMRLARKHTTVLSYIELADGGTKSEAALQLQHEALVRAGYRQQESGMLPTKTWQVNLKKPSRQLRSEMHKKTRYNLGLAKRRGLVGEVISGSTLVREPDLQKRMSQLLQISARRGKYLRMRDDWLTQQLAAFGDDCFAVVIDTQGDAGWLAVALYLKSDDTAYYAHNGATSEGRRLMAPTLAVWEGMCEAQRRGMKRLDFDGVWDERVPKKLVRWRGFSRFKQSFGGSPHYYPLPYVKWGWW